jgi:hypothetical protein
MSKTGKPHVIRRLQKKPYYKCTAEQKEERVEFVASMITRRFFTSEIKKAVRLKFNIEFRQCAEYIACAKKLLAKQSQMSKEDAKSIGVNVLLDVLRTGTPHDRISAVRTLADIFGYNAPTKIEHSSDPTAPFTCIVKHAHEISNAG